MSEEIKNREEAENSNFIHEFIKEDIAENGRLPA